MVGKPISVVILAFKLKKVLINKYFTVFKVINMNLIKLALPVLILFSCVQENQQNQSVGTQIKYTKKHLKIDDSIISKRDPWEVIEPLVVDG